MLGSFVYDNPTRLYFGEDSLKALAGELSKYGPVVQLICGGGSIKRNGIYDQVCAVLKEAGKTIVEDAGVMPNPTIGKVREGAKIARESGADLLLAVGGGSCCDYAKAVAASAFCDEDPWDRYYVRNMGIASGQRVLPVGCVLTMAGTGSEMNGTAVITNPETRQKLGHKFGPQGFPRFAILNPVFTYSLPAWQLSAGIFDIFCHICEQYFSGTDDNTSDYISEGLMRSVIHAGRIAVKNPTDYEARSNLMWAATWALNTLLGLGKTGDWMVHKFGQSIGAFTDATHGMTLSCVTLPYYRRMLPHGTAKYRRFAEVVWNVDPAGRDDTAVALEGLARMEAWMREIGVVLSAAELGVTEAMLDDLSENVIILEKASYKALDRAGVREILAEALRA
ncbi:MAG: iron-containing alcohol dehydrogenase [Desulfovibrionaceae bacterium]|nr:iron-containing alcohol dehydrogenase [Desulfovibrionaceae bacterium]